MEFFRRLRIIWTALSIIAAALAGLSYLGAPSPAALPWFFAAVASAVAFHIAGSWRVKLSALWIGGFGLFVYGAFMANVNVQYGNTPSKALLQAVALTAVPWLIAATAVWLFGGLRRSKT